MARLSYDDSSIDGISSDLGSMGRDTIRKIVEAGARADAEEWRRIIIEANHVRTGSMRDSVQMTEYRETMGGGQISVYPQGTDMHGISNTIKAYVTNYGRGKRKRGSKMGDKFITKNEGQIEEIVAEAMQAEADRLMARTN